MELEQTLIEIENAIDNYDNMQREAEVTRFNEYLMAYNAKDYGAALRNAPQELRFYLQRFVQLDTEVSALEADLSQQLAIQRIEEYARAGALNIFTEDVAELVRSVTDKKLIFDQLRSELEVILTKFCNGTARVDSEAFERFLDAFEAFRDVIEGYLVEMLSRIDVDGRFCVSGPFQTRYTAAVYSAQCSQLFTQYSEMVERELDCKQETLQQEIFPESEQEKYVFERVMQQKAQQSVQLVELQVLEFCRKPVFTTLKNNDQTMPFVADACKALEELHKLEEIAQFVCETPCFAECEHAIIESMRALSKAAGNKVLPHCALHVFSALRAYIHDLEFLAKAYELEFETAKELFYAQFAEYVDDFEELMAKTRGDFAANETFVQKRVTAIIETANSQLSAAQRLRIPDEDADNIRYSVIAGIVDRLREIIVEESGTLNGLSRSAFAAISQHVHAQCARIWWVNKRMADNTAECLEAYGAEYRSVCEQLRCYWMMANFAIGQLEVAVNALCAAKAQ